MSTAANRYEIVARAASLIGKPWRVDGHGPDHYDAWGVVAHALGSSVSPPRSNCGLSSMAARSFRAMLCERIDVVEAKPGDVIAFWVPRMRYMAREGIHVAVLIWPDGGNSRFIHSIPGGGVVEGKVGSHIEPVAAFRHNPALTWPMPSRAA
jgi:cell wall-associated NlpC family hydrolase